MRIILLLILISSVSALKARFSIPESKAAAAAYPEWAHHHWIWIPRGSNTQQNQKEWFDSWKAHNISVGAVNIDSTWSSGINNFIWNPQKFPNPRELIQYLKSHGSRVILWTTSVINQGSSNYQEGFDNNYYLNNGTTFKWWHGVGSFLDYSNPFAVDWWHKQLDKVLALGIDGWKCDGTDPFVMLFVWPYGYKGEIGYHEYAEMYYRDFLHYTRKWNKDALIMSRPVDSVPPIYWSYSPYDVMFSGWVGDQQHSWPGFQHAMDNMLISALRGYVNFGSDIGGYLGVPKGGSPNIYVFTRWYQQGAFIPLMENGGNGEHRPWMWDEPGSTTVLDNYRMFVNTHLELEPYLLNAGTVAFETNATVMHPMAIQAIFPHSYDYRLGEDIFVAPIVDDPGTYKVIEFPEQSDWMYYWNSRLVYNGGSTHNITFALSEFPAYQRVGSMIPLYVKTSDTGKGDENSAGKVTAMIAPAVTASPVTTSIRLWEGLAQDLQYHMGSDGMFKFSATAHPRSLILFLRGINNCPSSVFDEIYGTYIPQLRSSEGVKHNNVGYYCDMEARQAFIHLPSSASVGTSIVASF